jgi:hypothetical protein
MFSLSVTVRSSFQTLRHGIGTPMLASDFFESVG